MKLTHRDNTNQIKSIEIRFDGEDGYRISESESINGGKTWDTVSISGTSYRSTYAEAEDDAEARRDELIAIGFEQIQS